MMKSNNIKQKNKGFSLIEMLIAITIFAVGLLAMAQLQTHSIVYNAQAQRYTEATIHAQNIMDFVFAEGYDFDPDLVVKEYDAGSYGPPEVIVTPRLVDSKRYKDVDVIFTWTYRGQSKNYTLSSIIAKRDN